MPTLISAGIVFFVLRAAIVSKLTLVNSHGFLCIARRNSAPSPSIFSGRKFSVLLFCLNLNRNYSCVHRCSRGNRHIR